MTSRVTVKPTADLALDVLGRPLRRIRMTVPEPNRLSVTGRLFDDELGVVKANKAVLIDFVDVFSPLRLRQEDGETIRRSRLNQEPQNPR